MSEKSKKVPKKTVNKTKAEEAGIKPVNKQVKDIKKIIQQGEPEVQVNLHFDHKVKCNKPREKRILTEEQLDVLRERLVKARLVKAEKKRLKDQVVEVEVSA